MSEGFLAEDIPELTPEDLEDIEPEDKVVEHAYDLEVYSTGDGKRIYLRDNPECVWVGGGDVLYCAGTGRPILGWGSKLGQNDMGSVTTGTRPGCPYHEPHGPSSYSGSFDHEDVWNLWEEEWEEEVESAAGD